MRAVDHASRAVSQDISVTTVASITFMTDYKDVSVKPID